MKTIRLDVELPRDQAYALAELCKRIGFQDALKLAVDKEEAYRMIHATDKVRGGLEKSGVAVR